MMEGMVERIKRQDLPAGLWVVATPIGNRGDCSERAISALAQADQIYCEDTRRTRELLSALGVTAGGRLQRLDAHASERVIQETLNLLRAGASVAFVSDAGTPAVSDPGSRLVAAARAAGVRISVVPGPSAVAAFVSIAGVECTAGFTFEGYFPRESRDRVEKLDEYLKTLPSKGRRLAVWFESPERMEGTLAFLANEFVRRKDLGAAVELIVAKELTKVHERVWVGTPESVLQDLRAAGAETLTRGEWVLGLAGVRLREEKSGAEVWPHVLEWLLEARVPPSEASRKVSQLFGVPKKTVYSQALEMAGKKKEAGD